MGGWIKLHRKILDNEIWSDVTTFRLFTLLLLRASHKNGVNVRGTEINRGQYLRSYSKLAEDLEYKEGRGYKKVSKSTIMRSVRKLFDSGMVTVNETDSGTVFTIVNYHEYQRVGDDNEELTETDSGTLTKRTQNEPRTNPEREQELKNLRTKELKESTTTTPDRKNDPIHFYQENFGMVTSYVTEDLLNWIEDLGDELVLEAMKRAIERNKKNWGYVKSILRSWLKKNITTIEQVEAEDVEFQNQRSQRSPFYQKQQAANIVPDWHKNGEHKKKAPAQNIGERTEEQKKVDEMLRQYRAE